VPFASRSPAAPNGGGGKGHAGGRSLTPQPFVGHARASSAAPRHHDRDHEAHRAARAGREAKGDSSSTTAAIARAALRRSAPLPPPLPCSTPLHPHHPAFRSAALTLRRRARPRRGDHVTAEEEIKGPYILEFLDLKDEFSETEIESALIRHLQSFLLELGGDFAFVGRQRRLRVGDAWYRVDLLFYHRRLRCLVVIDLKLGKFTHADAGQMHLCLDYAQEHWTMPGENPPLGLIVSPLLRLGLADEFEDDRREDGPLSIEAVAIDRDITMAEKTMLDDCLEGAASECLFPISLFLPDRIGQPSS
jgi:hypothetical protein